MQSSARINLCRREIVAVGMAAAMALFLGIGAASASELKLSMRLSPCKTTPARSTEGTHLSSTTGTPSRVGGFTLGAIPATFHSVGHFLSGLRHRDSVSAEKTDDSPAEKESLSLYDKTTSSIGLIPYGVSVALSKDLDLQYAGNSAAVGSGAPWQSLRMINKDDPERHWYFALDKIQFERKDAISAGVGVLLPLR